MRIFIFLAIIYVAYALPTQISKCSDAEYFCGESNGGCIPLEWVCDNVKDCSNGKDEANCNYLHSCSDGDFMCRSGECVSARFKCDGRSDCSDGSDEATCVDKVLPTSDSPLPTPNSTIPSHHLIKKTICTIWEFKCEKSDKCIDRSKICNGLADCEYMEDEADCNENCRNGGVRCNDNSGCYLNRCDGYKECEDGSDEEGCDYHDLPSMDDFFGDHFHGCQKDEFKCSDNRCIQKSKLCDGQKDCISGEDEGGLCGACSINECSYKCQDSPKGPECYCPQGAFLTADFKTCEISNPCLEAGGNQCSQLCKPKGSSSSCYCAEGYQQVGSTYCEVNDEHKNGELFFTVDGFSIRRNSIFNTSGSYYEEVASVPTKYISSVSLNPNYDDLYFVAKKEHFLSHVFEVKNDGNLPESILAAFDLKDIAVDWVTGNIYYAVEGPYPGIGVCTADGLYCKQLIDGEYTSGNYYTQRYGGLIVHPQRGLVIWLSYNSEHPEGVVHLMGMDGSNDRVLSNQINRPKINSIAMDYVRDYLFVGEDSAMIRYDLHTLKTEAVKNPIHAKSMIVFNGQFYFIGRDSKLKVAKFGEPSHEVIKILGEQDIALAINNTVYYSKLHDPCQTMHCSHICVLTEKQTAKCICPDQYKMNERTNKCEPIEGHNSRVKISASNMISRCVTDSICQNGGSCLASYNDSIILSPFCKCPIEFTGLYCEVPNEQVLTAISDSSSGWKILFWIIFCIIIFSAVFYFVSKNPEFKDRLQHFTSMLPRMNNPFGQRVRNENRPLSKGDNTEIGFSATPARSQAIDELSKSSFMNPVFGSSPNLAKSNTVNTQESLSSLHKSPSAAGKLNLEG
uniref:EGF-like domain-containing protein n=1 Tax=Acrobeloides nanus TaxID=290746 RepID=A0A914CAR2_9BILA